MPNFEVFTKRMGTLAKDPAVTIQKRGLMSMNASAHHLIGSPEAVELLYDAEARILGLRGVSPTVGHAYRLRVVGSASSTTYVLSGTAFCKYYRIDTEISRRWPAEVVNDVLCIDFNVPGTVVTSNRTAREDASSTAASI